MTFKEIIDPEGIKTALKYLLRTVRAMVVMWVIVKCAEYFITDPSIKMKLKDVEHIVYLGIAALYGIEYFYDHAMPFIARVVNDLREMFHKRNDNDATLLAI